MTQDETTILSMSGLTPNSNVAIVTANRANIFEMSQAAEQSVLRPKNCGAFGHELRAALAARVVRMAGDEALATHYLADAGSQAALAEPGANNADLSNVLTFVDKVSNHTRNVSSKDIEALRASGVSDADIVRLCELVAFLAYQVRVIAGLRLMQSTAA